MWKPFFRCRVLICVLFSCNVCYGNSGEFESMIKGIVNILTTSLPWKTERLEQDHDESIMNNVGWNSSYGSWATSILSSETAWDYVESVRARTPESFPDVQSHTTTLSCSPIDRRLLTNRIDEVSRSIVRISGVVVAMQCLYNFIKSNLHHMDEVCINF
jgi:hypothetical protein